MTDGVEVAIFAKAPIANFAKSRLIHRLGAQGAADLQDRFIRQTVETIIKSGIRPISLWCTPDQSHPLFVSLGQAHDLTLYNQAGDDLGMRMLLAFETLSLQRSLLLVGTDCPVLAPDHLALCASALRRGADGVFLPTEDGGYALIGLRKPIPEIFGNMPWSTNQVMTNTRDRMRKLGLEIAEPAILWDVDTAADYDRAMAAG